jgi:hypothetical protein
LNHKEDRFLRHSIKFFLSGGGCDEIPSLLILSHERDHSYPKRATNHMVVFLKPTLITHIEIKMKDDPKEYIV